MNKKPENVRVLVRIGANINVKNALGKTPLELMLNSEDSNIRSLAFWDYDSFKQNVFCLHLLDTLIPEEYSKLLFAATNQVVLMYPSKRYKLNFLLENKVKFLLSDESNYSQAAEFDPRRNQVIVYIKNLDNHSFRNFCVIMAHEIEHGFKTFINRSHDDASPTVHEFNRSRYDYALPFYPFVMSELLRFSALIKKGDWYIGDHIFHLLVIMSQGENLNAKEKEEISSFLNACLYFVPMLTSYSFSASGLPVCEDGEPLLTKKPSDYPVKILMRDFHPESTFKIPFYVNYLFKNKDDTYRVEGYHTDSIFDFKQNVLALIYQIRKAIFNRQLGDIQSDIPGAVAEMHANLSGELPDEIISACYSELQDYDMRFTEIKDEKITNSTIELMKRFK